VATDYQRERWLLPSVRGEKHEAYAITEEFAGSDVSALQTTARRDGDEYVINGTKWHVTSFNLPTTSSSRPSPTAGTTCCWWSTCRGRRGSGSHAAVFAHIADEHPIVAFNDVRVPAANLSGSRADR
jgi:Acyl-CoA dehydrogenases